MDNVKSPHVTPLNNHLLIYQLFIISLSFLYHFSIISLSFLYHFSIISISLLIYHWYIWFPAQSSETDISLHMFDFGTKSHLEGVLNSNIPNVLIRKYIMLHILKFIYLCLHYVYIIITHMLTPLMLIHVNEAHSYNRH